MGKISTYTVLSTPTVNDKLIGTDVTTNNETKNFLVSDLLALSEGNVGKLLGGGIVVAEWNENGVKKALIASLTDLSAGLPWTISPYDALLIGPTAKSFSNGLTNTNAIIAQTTAPAANTYAAGIARLHNGGSFSDWYLPAAWELNMCSNSAAIVNKVLGDINGFKFNASALYWSSTEYNAGNAWYQFFQEGIPAYSNKSDSYYVRAVRIHNI
jgi:hypothetical protein